MTGKSSLGSFGSSHPTFWSSLFFDVCFDVSGEVSLNHYSLNAVGIVKQCLLLSLLNFSSLVQLILPRSLLIIMEIILPLIRNT